MRRAFVGLGSNLGDREAHLAMALQELQSIAEMDSLACSPWYETEAVGGPAQPDYLNGVAAFLTSLSPLQILEKLHSIEMMAKRERLVHWGPRTLDLDLLLVDQLIEEHEEPALSLPHPRLHLRRFVLLPLAALAPTVLHPIFHQSAQELLHSCLDQSTVRAYIPQKQLTAFAPTSLRDTAL